MSFAGGVVSLSGEPKYLSAPCPTLLLHGTADSMVAYNKLSMGGRGIWGSDFLATQWAKKGYTGWCIYRFKDRPHDVAAYMSYLWDIEEAFLEQNASPKERPFVKPRKPKCLIFLKVSRVLIWSAT